MPVTISQSDLKINIAILHDYAKQRTGPLAIAATRLVQLWATQLTETSKRDLSLTGIDLEGYGA